MHIRKMRAELPAATQHHVSCYVPVPFLRVDAERSLGIRIAYVRTGLILQTAADFPSTVEPMAATRGVMPLANRGQQRTRRLRGNRVGAIVEAGAQRCPLVKLMRHAGSNHG